MAFMRCNGIVMHAERRGPADRPAVVFVNSLGTDTRIWDAVLPFFVDRYSVVTYDKRGHGLSDVPPGPYGIDDFAEDLSALVGALGIERFALVGLSVGGLIAQAVAARHPARVPALVLCDTAAQIGTPPFWNARIDAVTRHGMAEIAPGILERWFTRAYRERDGVAMAGWFNMLTRQPAEGYAATCAAIRDADLRAEAATITAPTLCLTGDQDVTTPPALVAATAALIPNARFATVADAGHIPCVEQPAVLAGLILDHLAAADWA